MHRSNHKRNRSRNLNNDQQATPTPFLLRHSFGKQAEPSALRRGHQVLLCLASPLQSIKSVSPTKHCVDRWVAHVAAGGVSSLLFLPFFLIGFATHFSRLLLSLRHQLLACVCRADDKLAREMQGFDQLGAVIRVIEHAGLCLWLGEVVLQFLHVLVGLNAEVRPAIWLATPQLQLL